VAVLRLHVASASHVTRAAYSCVSQVYVLQSTKEAPELRRISIPRTSVNKALVRDAPGGSGCHYGSSKGGPTVLGWEKG
jgi:hypothetical protein